MIADIHSHMLPAVDDGAENFDITKEMVKMAYDEGCRYLFFTPHSDSLNNEATGVKEKFEMVKTWINDNYPDLKAYLGCEIYADPDDFESIETIIDKLNKGIYLTLNGTKYVLIEFYLGGFKINDVIPSIKAFQTAGYIPVIAHVERYGISVEDIKRLKNMGCMIQINIGNVFNPKRMSAMYDIKNLKIWKETERENPLLNKKYLIEIDAFIMEAIMRSDYSKINKIFSERFIDVNKSKGKSLRFNIYMSDKLSNTDIDVLDLGVRANNCLKRAGIMTIGDLCNKIHSSSELKMIRNCGNTSVVEIMDKLFYYHFMQLPSERQQQYIDEVVKLNS